MMRRTFVLMLALYALAVGCGESSNMPTIGSIQQELCDATTPLQIHASGVIGFSAYYANGAHAKIVSANTPLNQLTALRDQTGCWYETALPANIPDGTYFMAYEIPSGWRGNYAFDISAIRQMTGDGRASLFCPWYTAIDNSDWNGRIDLGLYQQFLTTPSDPNGPYCEVTIRKENGQIFRAGNMYWY